MVKVKYQFLQKKGWAKLWPIFSKTRLTGIMCLGSPSRKFESSIKVSFHTKLGSGLPDGIISNQKSKFE
jgi:hypothetical protein